MNWYQLAVLEFCLKYSLRNWKTIKGELSKDDLLRRKDIQAVLNIIKGMQ